MNEGRMPLAIINEMAKRYHEMMAQEISHPGDVIMVAAMLLTNLLALEIASSGSAVLVDQLVEAVKGDARIIAGRLVMPEVESDEPITVQ